MEETDQLWEINAAWWQRGFTEGADAEYEQQILPLAAQHLAGANRVLDVGCGEGQVSRLAASLPGVEEVVGIDPTWAQLTVAVERAERAHQAAEAAEAAEAAPRPAFVRGEAAQLPLADSSFDSVVACLVFEHIKALDRAVAEVARVLQPGGRFLFFLNHPLLQTPGSGWIDDTILGEQYWRIGPYLREDEVVEEVERNVFIPFVHRPLSRYINAMAGAGMLVTHMEEPGPPPGFLARAQEYLQAATIPRLLFLRAEMHE